MSGRWFPLDDECGPVHGRFLMALRRHALDWPASIDPTHSGAFVLDGVLATYVDVVDDDGIVTSWRMDYDGTHLTADETLGGLGVSGSPDACAAEASRWLLEKLRGAPA
jgi:hypothetical protein